MLQAIRIIREMEQLLDSLVKEKQIQDFRISYFLTGGIDVYVLSKHLQEEKINQLFKDKFSNVDYFIELIEEWNSEDYKDLFQTQEKILLKSKRSLRNAFNPILEDQTTPLQKIPKLVFYSYKGGVGRTTTLCAYAMYLASQFQYKVVIIDCDLEAPGVTNFFTNYITKELQGGLVEYLLDSIVLKTPLDLYNYFLEVTDDLSKAGKIYIIPAGNLSQNTYDHLRDYLEGLSRVDFFYGTEVSESFKKFLDNVEQHLSPDVILFDSRTGFHDMAFYLMTHHSNLNVCFFGSTEQNFPGLQYVLQRSIQDGLPVFLVNSILPVATGRERFQEFQKKIEELIQENLEETQSKPAISVYPLIYDERLHNIGVENREILEEHFIRMILNDRTELNQYYLIFREIDNFLGIPKPKHKLYADIQNFSPKETTPNLEISISEIISELSDIMPKSIYADTTKATDEFLQNYFYIRSCFQEILELTHNKFLCIGSKGSGKTAIYKAMQNHRYMQKFFKDKKVSILPMASIMEDNRDVIKFKTDGLIKKFANIGIQNIDWKNFWMIYTWNAINIYRKQILEELKFDLLQTTGLIQDFSSKNLTQNTEFFSQKLQDSDYLKELENKLNQTDKVLYSKNLNLILIYDQLDFIVEPIQWDVLISPLIEFFRMRRFKAIHPRLFVRRDLYNRLGRLTNKNNLTQNFSISLEWNKDEIFAMFFKIAWNSKKLVQYFETELDTELIREIQTCIQNKQQIPHTSYTILKELVRIFFGEYAGKNPSWGTSYNWFFLNLKNADDTISVRPFLDLIQQALNLAKQRKWSRPPVLSWQFYSAPEIRVEAVRNHYNDMVNEQGNEVVKKLFNFIQSPNMPKDLRYIFLSYEELKKLIHLAKEKADIQEETEEVIQKLVNLGIIAEPRHRNQGMFSFALLYKYYLNLRGRRIERR